MSPPPDGGGSGWCYIDPSAAACFTPSGDRKRMTATAGGIYGYGKETLGQVTYKLEWRLNGHQLSGLIGTWSSSAAVASFGYDAAFEWADQADAAFEWADQALHVLFHATSPTRSRIPGGNTYTWTVPKKWVDNNHSNYSAELGGSWEVEGYPGLWYINIRSPIWTCASQDSACYFSEYLPVRAIEAGYK
jgi:hypothetical protein